MHKYFIITNVILLSLIGYLVFGQAGITGYAVLGEGSGGVIVGSSLYYKVTDVESRETLSNESITNREIYMVRKNDEIKEFSKLKLAKEWDITADADSEKDHCANRTYYNREYYYDDNGNDAKDGDEFIVYSVFVDDKGCFNIRLPDEKFVVVLGKKN